MNENKHFVNFFLKLFKFKMTNKMKTKDDVDQDTDDKDDNDEDDEEAEDPGDNNYWNQDEREY